MRKRKDEQFQLYNVQPVKKVKTTTDKRNEDNPDDVIPNSIPTLGSAIPGVDPIPPHSSGDRSGD
eukprot:14020363-Heterocapsa_arctica.AAC.1